MRYIEFKITVDREMLETAEAVLLEHGYDSMQIDDPSDVQEILDHKDLYKYDYINEELSTDLTRKPTITLYFTDDEEGLRHLADTEALLAGMDGVCCEASPAGDDSEWLYKWQEHFKPAKVGERIVVKPGWEDYDPSEGELVIEMDPGMAFGSGLHETTSMCVKALEKYMPEDARVLDVGTGTGILAMAAVLLGAENALGIDIDEEAVRVATENIRKNDLEGSIAVMKGDLMSGVDYSADVIVANLMADLVMMLSPAAAEQLGPGGIYITSGILDVKEDAVKGAIEAAGFDIIEVLADGEWRAITAVKRQGKQ
ncbi:MAG: 50S ribosomal protein L11 methyltransferase [Mogibacterium sp.]|nr:50S ribosomal protein L11 methyltransferase [Mogibacterium sp.]